MNDKIYVYSVDLVTVKDTGEVYTSISYLYKTSDTEKHSGYMTMNASSKKDVAIFKNLLMVSAVPTFEKKVFTNYETHRNTIQEKLVKINDIVL